MKLLRFFRSVYHDNGIRLQNRRSIRRDLWLYARNRALGLHERRLVTAFRDDTLPVVFIVGAPRSGTTLLFQLIASRLRAGYPSNFVARYWMAPVYGSQRYRRSLGSAPADIPLQSSFGGTRGAASPHEFSWFWSYLAPLGDCDDLTEAELDAFDWPTIRAELGALAGFWRLPYVFKSLNHTVYNIARFAKELPQSRFLYITRDAPYVVQSILACRVERYGDARKWWTIRPRDVAEWRDRDPIEQVCHQVNDIQRAIERDLANLPAERQLRVSYERMIDDPGDVLRRVARLLGGEPREEAPLGELPLVNGNVQRVDDDRFASFRRGLRQFA